MFTVLHREMDGREMLYTANHVQFIPRTQDAGDTAGVHMLCGPTEAAHGVHVGHFGDGDIFVMNDKGKTVARYSLSQPPSSPPMEAVA